jgi:hypothetical protein
MFPDAVLYITARMWGFEYCCFARLSYLILCYVLVVFYVDLPVMVFGELRLEQFSPLLSHHTAFMFRGGLHVTIFDAPFIHPNVSENNDRAKFQE